MFITKPQPGESNFGKIGGHCLSHYARGNRPIDKTYGIRKETDGTLLVGDSPLTVGENSNVTVRGVMYEGP